MFDFIEKVKNRGKWSSDEYNFPMNNCQHFTSKLIGILKNLQQVLDSYVSDKINYYSLDPKDSEHNEELATIDQKALLTQLSTAKVVLERLPSPQTQTTTQTVSHTEETNYENIVSSSNVSTLNQEPIVQSRDVDIKQESEEDTMKEIEECMRRDQEENKNLTDKIVIDSQEFTNIRFREISLEPKIKEEPTTTEAEQSTTDVDESEEEEIESQSKDVETEFVLHEIEDDNSQYAGRKFGLVMLLNETDYNNGDKVDNENEQLPSGEVVQFALTMVKDKQSFINPAGLKLTIAEPNIENNVFQQFIFGNDKWNTVIDSVEQRGMVWDVADELNTDPPSGTPFYLFPFHGKHNQHFVYKDGMIIAQQNGHAATFVGGDKPLVMMLPSKEFRARQTFTLQ